MGAECIAMGRCLGCGCVRAECENTPGWEDPKGYDCSAYARNGWCIGGRMRSGMASFFGEENNSPEKNCCFCGKGAQGLALLQSRESASSTRTILSLTDPCLGANGGEYLGSDKQRHVATGLNVVKFMGWPLDWYRDHKGKHKDGYYASKVGGVTAGFATITLHGTNMFFANNGDINSDCDALQQTSTIDVIRE